jgi:hypothetical protein
LRGGKGIEKEEEMTQVNKDRDVTWKTKFPPRIINGHRYKKGHSGLFLSEFGADNSVQNWKSRGYRARKELVFLHEGKDRKGISSHPMA